LRVAVFQLFKKIPLFFALFSPLLLRKNFQTLFIKLALLSLSLSSSKERTREKDGTIGTIGSSDAEEWRRRQQRQRQRQQREVTESEMSGGGVRVFWFITSAIGEETSLLRFCF